MNQLLEIINIKPELLAQIGPIVILVMGILSGLALMLNAIAKFTKTDADDKAVGILGKVIAAGQKLVDFFAGNVKH